MSTVHAKLQEIIANCASTEGSWVGMSTLLDLDRQIIKLKGRISGFMMQPQQNITVQCPCNGHNTTKTEVHPIPIFMGELKPRPPRYFDGQFFFRKRGK